MAKNRPDWSRRTVLKSIGIGATVPLFGGVAAANNCPGCPEGTRLLAKYNFDGENFRFEKGACEDPFTEIDYTNKEGEEGEPIEVSFTSPVVAHDIVVKRGPDCELASDNDNITFTIDDEKDNDGFEHTISVPEDSRAISHFSVCAGVCFQVDFVVGDVIKELGEDGFYRDRLIAARWDGTAVEDGQVVNNSSFTTSDDDEITTADGVTLNADETEGSVTFDVDLGSDDVTLTLASYVATCPPRFEDGDTADTQDLVDWKTKTYTSDGTDTLTVDLPGTEWLDELCVD